MTKPTDDQINRMTALIREMGGYATTGAACNRSLPEIFTDARRLAQDLPKPVEPDVLIVREILGIWSEGLGDTLVGAVREGSMDRSRTFQAALAEYRRTSAPRDA